VIVLPLALACFAAAELAHSVVVVIGNRPYAVVWIPLGLLAAVLLREDRRRWPALCATAAVSVLVSGILIHGDDWLTDTLAMATTIVEAVAVAVLVRRAVGGPFKESFELTQVPHVWNLALMCALVAGLGGLLDAALLDLRHGADLLVAWRTRTMGELDGLLLAAPAALGVVAGPSLFSTGATKRRRIEATLAIVLALVVVEAVFGDFAPSAVRAPAYALPMLLWIAFRCEAGDAALAMFAVCMIGVWNTAEGRGPFTLVGPQAGLDAWILRAQGASVTASLSIMLLAAVVAERRQAADERSQLVIELQNALAEIKTLHGLIPLCAWCHKIRDDAGAWQALEGYLQEHTDATFSHSICPSCTLAMNAEQTAEVEAHGRSTTS
jgi:integral membrane sensor domain MASE1